MQTRVAGQPQGRFADGRPDRDLQWIQRCVLPENVRELIRNDPPGHRSTSGKRVDMLRRRPNCGFRRTIPEARLKALPDRKKRTVVDQERHTLWR